MKLRCFLDFVCGNYCTSTNPLIESTITVTVPISQVWYKLSTNNMCTELSVNSNSIKYTH